MKGRLLYLLLLFWVFTAEAQKRIYIPADLRPINLESDTSRWSFSRSVETRDLIFMWERGFGNDLQNPPQLDGHAMSFNLSVLTDRVQRFYTFFRDTLGFVRSTEQSKADRYKMMVMVNYSLDGTAYGGCYDDFIGALWVAPNRIQDHTMNCMAHELGHSFQSQIMADSVGQCWGGSPFFEMASQWMLWQVNPWWLRDENYHFEAFKTLTHRAFLHMDNIYHSPYVLQWWSDLHGRQFIAELFRQGRVGEDPVQTYQRMNSLTQQQFLDEMLQGYQHLVNFDFHHAWKETRPYACTWQTPLDTLSSGWLQPKDMPEDYGFNIIPLSSTNKVRVKVEGQYLRWALVAVTSDGRSIYGQPQSPVLKVAGARFFLVVMGAPETHKPLYRHGHKSEPTTYPYRFKVF